MKRLWVLAVSVVGCLLVDVSWSHAQDGKGFVINEGPRAQSGVGATAQTVDPSKTTTSIGHEPRGLAQGRSTIASQPPLIANRCTGLVSGDSFSAFSNSTTCGSFAAPVIGNAPPPAPTGPATNPREIAAVLADRAMALAADPDLRISPSAIGLTGLDSYFWLANEPRPIVATADVPGIAVTAEARPIRYSWDFGDGTTRSTTHIGRRWTRRRPGNIAHLYETSDTYTVRAAVVWEARWRLGTGAWQPLGYFTTADSVEYPVRQIVALLVRPH
jgi:hypothetical protein